jgi:hypothetical protein
MVNIGWVGNYSRGGKNYGQAIRVCRRHRDWNLLTAGGKDSGVHVNHYDMPGFYHECDVLLVTSVWEAHPLAVYEAVACCTPVVMGKHVGDCYRNDLQGVVYVENIDDDEKLDEAIRLALQYRDILVENGLKSIHEKWLWRKVAPYYYQMFTNHTGKEEPHITFLTNERDWSWGYMAEEIKRYVYPKLEIYALNEHSESELKEETWEHTDLVLNHPWHIVSKLGLTENIPIEKHILCVNGPAFINPSYMEMWRDSLMNCSAISTVSLNILDLLRFTGKPLFYTPRGVDTTVFTPPLKYFWGDYLHSQEHSARRRLKQLGVET